MKQLFAVAALICSVLGAGASGAALQSSAAVPAVLSVGSLTTEHQTDPLGIDSAQPRFGWKLTSSERGGAQTAYQILVSSSAAKLAQDNGDLWNTGQVSSAQSYEIPYGGTGLQSRTAYYWKARVWDNHDHPSQWSDPAQFETAFVDPSQWATAALWIGRNASSPPMTELPEPLLRKAFTVSKTVAQARVYIAGLGYYKLYLNGQRIGDHVLDPGFTDYNHRVLYVTYDVTPQLRQGDNAIGVSLGRGFYAVKNNPLSGRWQLAPWNSEPKLKLELDVRYTDGTSLQVVTDPTWKTHDGPVTKDNMAGETYDARNEVPGWTQPGFDDSLWTPALGVTPPAGQLQAQPNEPIKVADSLPPVGYTTPAAGTRVYDVGTVTSGWARITFDGTAGTTVAIRYSEKLVTGGTAELEAGQEDTYILKGGGPETYEPSYGYKGFRYVQVSATTLPAIDSIEAKEVHSAVASTGGFDSSSDLLNRYHLATQRTILNNLDSIPTDTPVYEKAGWTGDGHEFGESAIRNFGMARFYEKWLQDFTDAQFPDGHIPQIVPAPPGLALGPDPVWSGAVVYIHWYLYLNYGDVYALQRDYSSMKAWLTNFEDLIMGTGYIYRGQTYGDWTPPDQTGSTPTDMPFMGTAYLYDESLRMADIARVLGQTADAQHWDTLAASIKSAFNSSFYNATAGAYFGDSATTFKQTLQLVPLWFGLVAPDQYSRVLANLVNDIHVTRQDHLWTGSAGTKLILPLLTDNGRGELAFAVATNPTFPGWGYWFTQHGATTMWEEWPATSRSLDHAFKGTVDDWLFTRVAGIQPTAPAFTGISFKPYAVGDLTRASAFEESPLGRVSSSWSRSGSSFALDVTVPVGATALVYFPGTDPSQVSEIGQGNHQPAETAPGVELVGVQGDRIVYRVESGTYQFRRGAPTAVVVQRFSARRVRGGVALRWRTGSEAGLAGFTIYRGGWRLNAALMAARGSAAGASYRYLDRQPGRARYRLQAVRVDGSRTWAGSASVARR